MPKVLVGATGSVAAIMVPKLVRALQEVSSMQIEVRVIGTRSALHFFEPSSLSVEWYKDEDEWTWSQKGDPVLHIELRRWADLLVIAPLDANTMAKMAGGICDNLLTCVVRAWDQARPLLFCPAMNTFMWEHPITAKHVQMLEELGYVQVPPIAKTLACGDIGIGAMARVDDIVAAILASLEKNASLQLQSPTEPQNTTTK